jgi:hypothetical protein
MADAPKTAVETEATPPPATQTVWEAGGGTRMALSFLFLLLLPFYVSIGPMLYQRFSRGLLVDGVWLAILAVAFTVIMTLLLSRLIQAVRCRVELREAAVKFVVPAVRRGPFSLFRFTSREIPYTDIAAVDTRSEVYGGTLAPVMLTSTRLTTRDGQHTVLGYTDRVDNSTDFPFPEIGAAIAARAGKSVQDHGMVHRSISKRLSGALSSAAENVPLDADAIASINAAHARSMKFAIGGLTALVLIGIAVDAFTAGRSTYANLGAWGGDPSVSKQR